MEASDSITSNYYYKIQLIIKFNFKKTSDSSSHNNSGSHNHDFRNYVDYFRDNIDYFRNNIDYFRNNKYFDDNINYDTGAIWWIIFILLIYQICIDLPSIRKRK